MRRINIQIDDKIHLKSFVDVDELEQYLYNDLGFRWDPKTIADKIWDLNVGSKFECDGYRFSINSKRRVGNKLTDGTIIGAEQ
jgi:hypothetical protein|tara:strand:+ start:172 stop:420 length:249 start_codon:yes stop_codon:yes gene_type:complete